MVGTTTYKTSEHFFQAHLTANHENFLAILNTEDGWAAKRLARTLPRCHNYKEIQVFVMAEALLFKFLANSNLVEQLLKTPDAELLEENEWHDNYWGKCTCVKCKDKISGNRLGALLQITKDYFQRIHKL